MTMDLPQWTLSQRFAMINSTNWNTIFSVRKEEYTTTEIVLFIFIPCLVVTVICLIISLMKLYEVAKQKGFGSDFLDQV